MSQRKQRGLIRRDEITSWWTIQACSLLTVDACCFFTCCGCCGCCFGQYHACVFHMFDPAKVEQQLQPGFERCIITCGLQIVTCFMLPITCCGCCYACCGTFLSLPICVAEFCEVIVDENPIPPVSNLEPPKQITMV